MGIFKSSLVIRTIGLLNSLGLLPILFLVTKSFAIRDNSHIAYPRWQSTAAFQQRNFSLSHKHRSQTESSQIYVTNPDKIGVMRLPEVGNTDDGNPKTLILIRHGMSTANEFMDRPGNRWGDSTFTDDATLIDAPLSSKGVTQAKELYGRLKNYDLCLDDEKILVVTSPLTRCVETMNIGVLPHMNIHMQSPTLRSVEVGGDDDDDNTYETSKTNNLKKILVQPLARERVYTASDTGRPVDILQNEFPHLDFETCFQNEREKQLWWYSHDDVNTQNKATYKEWRPYGEGQYYAVPGEPVEIFNERMIQLFQWIKSREEQNIILVCHWGVIRWFTGEDVKNCHVKELKLDGLVVKDDMLQASL